MDSKQRIREDRLRLNWEPKQEMRKFSKTQTDVCTSLAKHMMTKEAPGQNFVFSPLSIHVVLGLMSAGFKGQPRDELLAYLDSDSCEEFGAALSLLVEEVFADGTPFGGPRLSFLNGMWIDHSFKFKDNFKAILDQFYKPASINHVDFKNKADAVLQEVNEWAEQKTNGLIKDILPPDAINDLTRFVFANALYFKGAWAEIFDESETTEDDFVLLDRKRVRVPFITSVEDQYITCYDDFKVLKLPYQNYRDRRKFSMYIYLPDANDGLPALVEKFSKPRFIKKHIPETLVEVGDFRFPKFKISYDFKACEVFKKMGLVTPFTSDLTEMAHVADDEMPLQDSKIFHKAFIEVNEQGAEAAAVSVWALGFGACRRPTPPPEVDFVADHPFLFVIREDKTGMVLFIGQVLNPAA